MVNFFVSDAWNCIVKSCNSVRHTVLHNVTITRSTKFLRRKNITRNDKNKINYVVDVSQSLCRNRFRSMATLDPKLLYRSDKFLVIDKDFDVKVNSYDPRDVITVDKQLSYSFPDVIDKTVEFGFRFQHRLDYATSGVLCVPLTKRSSSEFAKAFQKRTVLKHYLALVHGHVPTSYTYIDAPLCRQERAEDEPYKMKVVPKGSKNAKDCQTFVITMEKGFYADKPATKVLLIPFTGRTHQLRVHCKHIDHMIIGDYTYSNRTDLEPFRMMLHAHRLRVKLKDNILDVEATDPFTSSSDSLWKPDVLCMSYEACINKFYCKENDYQFKIQDDVQYRKIYL